MEKHILKIQKSILNNKLLGLHPIEAVQIMNKSFDLITIQEPSALNDYKRKERLIFHKPTEAEKKKASELHEVSLYRPIEISDLTH